MSWGDYFFTSWTVWLSAFCVLAIYTYLFKDNALYRTMMQVFIGINVGYAVVVQWKDILYPLWWLPMTDGLAALFGGGKGSPYGALWVLVGVLGLLWYFQLSRKLLWMSRIVIGITVGIGAGFTFKSLFGQNIPQVVDSFRPLVPRAVAAQPRKLFEIPATTVPSLLTEPLVIVATDKEATAFEALRGVVVWRTPLPAPPEGRIRKNGERILLSCGGQNVLLDRRTGAVVEGDPVADVPDTAGSETGWHPGPDMATLVKAAVPDAQGNDTTVLYTANGELSATNQADGKPLWPESPKVEADRLFDGYRYVLAEADGAVTVVESDTGTVMSKFQVPTDIAWANVVRMTDPIYDQTTAVAATKTGNLVSNLVMDHKVARRKAGETVWSLDFGKPLIWVASHEGVLYASGPEGGAAYEVPIVPKALGPVDYWDNWVFVITLMSVMTYFFFSFKRQPKIVVGTRRLGRYLLMLGFGAFFGNTVMSRMSYLLDRLMFLVDEWIIPFWHQLIGRF